ncbi:hypothetical protein KI387_044404, partial [Taxus chinensis]
QYKREHKRGREKDLQQSRGLIVARRHRPSPSSLLARVPGPRMGIVEAPRRGSAAARSGEGPRADGPARRPGERQRGGGGRRGAPGAGRPEEE